MTTASLATAALLWFRPDGWAAANRCLASPKWWGTPRRCRRSRPTGSSWSTPACSAVGAISLRYRYAVIESGRVRVEEATFQPTSGSQGQWWPLNPPAASLRLRRATFSHEGKCCPERS